MSRISSMELCELIRPWMSPEFSVCASVHWSWGCTSCAAMQSRVIARHSLQKHGQNDVYLFCKSMIPVALHSVKVRTKWDGEPLCMNIPQMAHWTTLTSTLMRIKCLHASKPQLKWMYATYVKMTMIMSLITLFRLNYCIYKNESLITILLKSWHNCFKMANINILIAILQNIWLD